MIVLYLFRFVLNNVTTQKLFLGILLLFKSIANFETTHTYKIKFFKVKIPFKKLICETFKNILYKSLYFDLSKYVTVLNLYKK